MIRKLILLAAAALAAVLLHSHVVLLAGVAALSAAVLALRHYVIVPRWRAWRRRMAVQGPAGFRDRAISAMFNGGRDAGTRARSGWQGLRGGDGRPAAGPPARQPAQRPAPPKAVPARPRQPQPGPARAEGQPAGRRVQPPPPPGPRGRGPRRALAQTGGAPAAWLALAESIASFEPLDDTEHLEFFAGLAAGIAVIADAVRANADTQFSVIGLDPAAAQATADVGDSLGACGEGVSLARQKFYVIYQELMAWAADHDNAMPHNGRWVTGGEAA